MRYMIGIDIGTSNTKAVALTPESAISGRTMVGYGPVNTASGEHELDPDVLFNAMLQCLQQLLSQMNGAKPEGISFSSAMHSLLAVDAAGTPLTNLVTWADLRSRKQAAQLKGTEQGNRIAQRTGTPIHAMSPLCKLIWMKEERSSLHRSAHRFIGIKEYLLYRLLGNYWIDHSIASATGLFDIYDRNWNTEALQLAGVGPERLSQPVPTTEVLTGLKKEYADLLSLDAGTPFIIGASDGPLANLGSNAMLPGDCSITIGTSGAVRMITDQPKYDPGGRTFSYILTDRLFVCGGPINNGGVLLKWYAENFLHRSGPAAADFNAFLLEAAQSPAGAEGLIFLPYIYGERAPVWDAYAKGMFIGLDSRHTQAHSMRAVVEGINYALYQVALAVEQTVGPIRNIYASGGFGRSDQWPQWLTNLFGREIVLTEAADASAMGAAIIGWLATGQLPELQSARQFLPSGRRFIPDPALHQLYSQYYSVYESLYDHVKEIINRLAYLPSLPT